MGLIFTVDPKIHQPNRSNVADVHLELGRTGYSVRPKVLPARRVG